MPYSPRVANHGAILFFYDGDHDHGRELSDAYSMYNSKLYEKHMSEFSKLFHLFRAGLYKSLASKYLEAEELWQKLVHERRRLDPDQIFERSKAHLLIYEAYALAKLGRYNEVTEPALKGYEWIQMGKGIYKVPHKNSQEYSLTEVLTKLVDHKLKPTPSTNQSAQDALLAYKEENFSYGRAGYDVIFDLQFSYPDIYSQVLPGPDPELD